MGLHQELHLGAIRGKWTRHEYQCLWGALVPVADLTVDIVGFHNHAQHVCCGRITRLHRRKERGE